MAIRQAESRQDRSISGDNPRLAQLQTAAPALVHSDAAGEAQLFRRKDLRPGTAFSSLRRAALAFAALALCLAAPAVPQQPIPPGSSSDGSVVEAPGIRGDRSFPAPAVTAQMEHRMADRRNSERQKELIADTDRLLALAQQLKAEVDKTDKNQLSLDVLKRADQIEKLAHSVKDKMRGN